MSEPATKFITSADELTEALRVRKDALNLSNATIERLAGLAGGHVGKLLGPASVKRMGPLSMFALAWALGLRIALVDDPEALAIVNEEGVKRKHLPHARRRALPIGQTALRRATPQVLSELGKAGAAARNAALTAEQRSSSARKASQARWKKRREARAAKKIPEQQSS